MQLLSLFGSIRTIRSSWRIVAETVLCQSLWRLLRLLLLIMIAVVMDVVVWLLVVIVVLINFWSVRVEAIRTRAVVDVQFGDVSLQTRLELVDIAVGVFDHHSLARAHHFGQHKQFQEGEILRVEVEVTRKRARLTMIRISANTAMAAAE